MQFDFTTLSVQGRPRERDLPKVDRLRSSAKKERPRDQRIRFILSLRYLFLFSCFFLFLFFFFFSLTASSSRAAIFARLKLHFGAPLPSSLHPPLPSPSTLAGTTTRSFSLKESSFRSMTSDALNESSTRGRGTCDFVPLLFYFFYFLRVSFSSPINVLSFSFILVSEIDGTMSR